MDILVLGAGVNGLSSAIRLLEAGHHVTIWARDLPLCTTSNVAAAIWLPYQAFPPERVRAWGDRAFAVFCALAADPASGVTLQDGIELLTAPAPDPSWAPSVRDFRQAAPAECLPGYGGGYCFTTPVIEMPVYLEYLQRGVRALGGEIYQHPVESLAEALVVSRCVVHCTGLGARDLVGDRTLAPIRGQIVRIAPLATRRFYLVEDETHGLTYIVPRAHDCILGGTAEPGNWSLAADPGTAAAILARCARLVPAIRDAAVLDHRVGLRPGRPAVRLEAESQPDGGLVVHNYGHGGAGVTLSWGCADEVVQLVQQHALRRAG